ncbi:MAG: hypothetical protein ACRDI0_06395 [Actinomycetota bacterium]
MRGARGLTLLLVSLLLLPGPSASAQMARQVLLLLIPGLTYQEALSQPTLRELARTGGVALLTAEDGRPLETEEEIDEASVDVAPGRLVTILFPGTAAPEIDAGVRALLQGAGSEEILVLIAAAPAEAGRVAPLILARGAPQELLEGEGPPRGLTSDTTRRPGIVAEVDLAPTILSFLGEPIPEGITGSPIRVEGEAPTALHERYVEYRTVVVPVGLAVLLFALAALVAGLVILFWPGAPARLAGAVAVWGLVGISFHVALLPGSWLPSFEPAAVVTAILVIGLAVAAVALWSRRWSPVAPVTVVAGTGLALVAVDAALGWPALLTPLLGGSALDGVRFFGLGNSYAGLVLAGAVLVAAVLRPPAGVALLVAAALFAGLPFLGADVGGALTLFVVAALWWALRVRGRLGPVEVAVTAAVAGAGVGILIVTHRLWPVSAHLTTAVSEGALGAFGHRLVLNYDATSATPAVWPALVMIPVAFLVAWRRWGPFAAPLRARPSWRDAVVVLAAGAMAGWLLNDTFGTASVAFVYLAAALVYPALEARWRSA